MTKYTVYYTNQYGTHVRSIPYGELTDFKSTCQRNNWKITKIVSIKDGSIMRTRTY